MLPARLAWGFGGFMSDAVSGAHASGSGRERADSDHVELRVDSMADDVAESSLLEVLVVACSELTGSDDGTMTLADTNGRLHLLSATSEPVRMFETVAVRLDEGPGIECVRIAAVVSDADLSAEGGRWAHLGAAATAAGIRSALSLPMRLGDEAVGVVSLYSRAVAPVSAAGQRLAQALTDVATVGVLHSRAARRSHEVAEQLQHALDSRVVIEQAKGVLAERLTMTMPEAFELLRRHARSHHAKLAEVAAAVTSGSLDLRARPQG
jgi:GAF domain-containing protein